MFNIAKQKPISTMLREALKEEGMPSDQYREEIRTLYSAFRTEQISDSVMKAMTRVTVHPAIAGLISLTFSERDIISVLGKFNGLNDGTSIDKKVDEISSGISDATYHSSRSSEIVDALAKYGKENDKIPSEVVNSPESRLNAIDAVYGSLESYKQDLVESVINWNGKFNALREFENSPAYNIMSGLIGVIDANVPKDSTSRPTIESAKIATNVMAARAKEVGNFGNVFLDAYAKIKTKEIRAYEKLSR